ncbi:MAG: 1-phosphofructokinase family hexose kinase [Anaerolineae bacterium]|nr:1-phosphofructokinase family hexose kinase [Anaerolineae bacterium]
MIITVSLNPSLDRTLAVPRLNLGELNRAKLLRLDLAGKGMNVSRALRALEIESKIVGFVGGRTGEALQEGLIAEGFDVRFVTVHEETRQNITLLDESCGLYTKINEPGAAVELDHIEAMEALIAEMVNPGDLVAFCGSLPPGAPPGLYARLIYLVRELGGQSFLDSSGIAFRQGAAACPYAIKPNDQEAAELLSLPLPSEQDCRAAVKRLMGGDQPSGPKNGIELVVLTRGVDGLVLGKNGHIVVAKPPTVDAQSPIGAGDSTLAGMLWAVQDSCDAVEMARRAVACGTAAAMQEGTGVGDRALVESLLSQIIVQ